MAVRSYQPQQFMLFFSNPKDILGQDHLCFVVDDIVEHLDLSALTNKQGTVGAPCYDYRLLIKVLFFGYATGTFSSRKIMKSTQENIAYIYLTRQQGPNFRTISDFRKNHRAILEDSFISIVKAAKEIGLIKLGVVSLDSTKIRANASNQKTFTQEELKEQKKRIRDAINEAIKTDDAEDKLYGEDKTGDELPEDIKDQKKRLEKIKQALRKAKELNKEKINITDQDANFMKSSNLIQTNYNCQLAVDNKTELIVSSEVKTCPADSEALQPQVETLQQTFKEKPKELLADSGYYSVDNLVYLEDNQIRGYLPHPDYSRDRKEKFKGKERLFDKQDFRYKRIKDQYICPEGNILRKKTVQSKRELTLYQARDCQQCLKKKLCLRGKAKLRLISRYANEDLLIKMRNRLATKSGRNKYKQRAPAAETPFGHFKKNLGFRQFLCRGQPRVSTEFKLLCIGYNIKKIASLISTPEKKMRFNSALKWTLN
ncbi:MAG: IS1182 family transposase [Candidatus Omnitrophica bacterium]|nr:IS1182 family transposase [Candidatus Omnitrophota bacterium]MBU4473630.1 IS1182 family transposase [Candidatus Omnitrophota bacterium]